MRLNKRTRKTLSIIIVIFIICSMLLSVVANFLPQQHAEEIDTKLLQEYLNSQNINGEEGKIIGLPDIEGTYQVVNVPSGNTLTVMWGNEEKNVKLIGVKEVSLTRNALEKKVIDDFVQLEFDVKEEDDEGNLLAYAYDSDGTFINYNLILHGDAKLDISDEKNTKHLDEFKDAQVTAKNNKFGCWSESNAVEEVIK